VSIEVVAIQVVKIGSNGQISFAEHNEANVDARNRDPADPFAYISRGPNSLKSSIEKKITISPIGVVSYRIL
jgi:CRISPR-associated endonuclease Csn1